MSGLINVYNSEGYGLTAEVLNLFGLKLSIPSPSYDLITEKVDGRGGIVVTDKTLNPRQLSARFFTKSGSYEDSLRLRDELYRLFSDGEEIFVVESKNSGKQWRVHPEGWSPDRINPRTLEFEIPLLAPNGLSESVLPQKRVYSTPSFVYRNTGDVPIDMRKQDETEILFSGASNGLTIKNLTTGDTWIYNGSTTVNDVILLKGVRSLKNNQSIFGQTNKRLISFTVGNNEFEISGVSGEFTLSISTRFYFL
ncbi:phage tail domain-containing protein [Sporosarcina highlanderae]|uniref:Phage tail family protein n=1 Tax=Sporosarcina highlanderae TaxID=3035916 RepID=A0ABT8JWE2_9BACL|nr:phage tail domain-containing protein [Sporosarcina highlanderae]MDN4609118.1 phage tail family protein [Sporosarcina highlanderae]